MVAIFAVGEVEREKEMLKKVPQDGDEAVVAGEKRAAYTAEEQEAANAELRNKRAVQPAEQFDTRNAALRCRKPGGGRDLNPGGVVVMSQILTLAKQYLNCGFLKLVVDYLKCLGFVEGGLIELTNLTVDASEIEGHEGLRYTSLCDGGGSCDPNWDDALKAWQDEIKQLSRGYVDLQKPGDLSAHEFTKMIWAKSDKVSLHILLFKVLYFPVDVGIVGD
ncbi:unnamed protein product [Darwinula stevensoni]|uniref:Uncharacterized protein n=1 Tax=Darwinula stevensoni TaxID=69355 RepID=A0A7R8XB65_9CRUS|nr:unnamed protein product [Darwinula stevensoni]CAG0887399.1 unnamed protein product [Darwinula stevensoni]